MDFPRRLTSYLNLLEADLDPKPPSSPEYSSEYLKHSTEVGPLLKKKNATYLTDANTNQKFEVVAPQHGIKALIGPNGYAGMMVTLQEPTEEEMLSEPGQRDVKGQEYRTASKWTPMPFTINQFLNNIIDPIDESTTKDIESVAEKLLVFAMNPANAGLLDNISDTSSYKEFQMKIDVLGINAYPILNDLRKEVVKWINDTLLEKPAEANISEPFEGKKIESSRYSNLNTSEAKWYNQKMKALEKVESVLMFMMKKYEGVNGILEYFKKSFRGSEEEAQIDRIISDYNKAKIIAGQDRERIKEVNGAVTKELSDLFSEINRSLNVELAKSFLEAKVKQVGLTGRQQKLLQRTRSVLALLTLTKNKEVKQVSGLSNTIAFYFGPGFPAKETERKPKKDGEEKEELKKYFIISYDPEREKGIGRVRPADLIRTRMSGEYGADFGQEKKWIYALDTSSPDAWKRSLGKAINIYRELNANSPYTLTRRLSNTIPKIEPFQSTGKVEDVTWLNDKPEPKPRISKKETPSSLSKMLHLRDL